MDWVAPMTLDLHTYPVDGEPRALLVLAHGAGAGQQHPFIVGTARGLARRGIDVATFDFPYMAAGRRAPDRPEVLERAFRDAIEAGRRWSRAARLFIGGKSMGGRIATHLGAEGVDRLMGIIALGYPLHPPAKPEQLRVAHLPRIAVPVLIVQGERDTFGTPPELQPVIETMGAPVTLHVVAGGDHSLAVKRGGPPIQEAVLDVVSSWVNSQLVQR